MKAPFSIATTLKCREGWYLIFGSLHFTCDSYLIRASVKQGGTKYHFLSLWYDNLGLNPSLSDHWWTLYSLSNMKKRYIYIYIFFFHIFMYIYIYINMKKEGIRRIYLFIYVFIYIWMICQCLMFWSFKHLQGNVITWCLIPKIIFK